MASELESKKQQARAAYDAASDVYDAGPLSFWERFGRRTIERLELARGQQVLDVCSGSGASAIPAAERVGSTGRVVAVDLSAGMLELARAKCRARGLEQVELRQGDLESLGYPDGHFDAVVCVFGIFFLPDMARGVRELWRMVRQGGQLAITTWGQGFLEPASSIFWETVRAEQPELFRGFNPWDVVHSEELLLRLMSAGGIAAPRASSEDAWHALSSPEDWWTIVLGTGYRGTTERLGQEARERVRRANVQEVARRAIRSVQVGVVFGHARKQG